MAFEDRVLPFWGGKPDPATASTARTAPRVEPFYQEASLVLFQFELAAITVVLTRI
jgi:ammonium transporter, Amt family